MKMKKMIFSLLLVFLVFTGKVFSGGGQAKTGAQNLVTLDLYSGPANVSGIQANSYWTDILKEDVGIQINLLPQSGDLFNAMLASGDLPDIVIVHEYSQSIDMIKAGLLLNYDDEKAKVPNVYNNIPTAIQYMRDNVSNGTGGLYALPNNVSNRPNTVGNLNLGPYLRWDLYKEMGRPAINEIEDLLPLLKRMADAHPVNDAGQKIYGVVLFSDWDKNNPSPFMTLADLASWYGGEMFGGTIEVDYIGNNAWGILDDRSWYKRGLKLWYTANQMGILDPDSVNQGWNEYLEKTSAGRNLLSLWPWSSGDFNTPERARAGVGFRLVPFNREKQTARGQGPNYVGNSWSWQVSKKTKKLDTALKYINYMWSYDGLWNIAYGRKGVYWDAGSDNKPFMTELAYKINDRIQEFPNGGYAMDGISVINSVGIELSRMIHPVYGIGNMDLWEKKSFAPPDNTLTADWKAVMNARDDIDYFTQHNMMTEQPFAPMNPAPDNILQIMARVGQIVQPASWQMVYARNEAEFNQIWQDMVTRAKGVGMDTAVKWYIDEYNRAKSFGSKYTK